ncbi:MAG: cytochrome c3 family protein [Bryobacterales bacterium]
MRVVPQTVQWTGANFDHNNTNFPLTGAHTSVAQCQTWSRRRSVRGLGTACATCHLDDFNATTDPDHAAAGFPQTCESCHTTVQWTGANFDHNNTNFPLTGAHTSVAQCQTCHVGGQFAGLARLARPATSTTSTQRRTRITPPPVSRRRASRAIRPRSGPAQTSTTTTRTSR